MPITAEDIRGVGGRPAGPYKPAEEFELFDEIARDLQGATTLDAVAIPPNAGTTDQVLDIINQGREPPVMEFCCGEIIDDNYIALISHNGEISAVARGTYLLPNPRASWAGVIHLAQAREASFAVGQVTVLRVPRDKYALCYDKNEPVIVYSRGGGFFVANDSFFRFEEWAPVNQRYVRHGCLHIIRVDKGELARVVESDRPALLPVGFHVFRSQTFQFIDFIDYAKVDSIFHRTITRFDVRSEYRALVWYDNQPVIFEEDGIYLIDTLAFRFDRFVPLEDLVVNHGSRKLITVRDGDRGMVVAHGQFRELQPGRHDIDDEDIVFYGFVNTQQEEVSLDSDGSEFLECQTNELVPIQVDATVFFSVDDALLATSKIGSMQNIKLIVKEASQGVVANILRSASLVELSRKAERGGDPSFLDQLGDKFHEELHDEMHREMGIDLLKVRIGSFKVKDRVLADAISQMNMIIGQTNNELKNIKSKREVEWSQFQTKMATERQLVDTAAEKAVVKARAEARAIVDESRARSEAAKIEAEADAKARVLIAEAEANATVIRALADAERARLVGSTEFGRTEALRKIRADCVRDSFEGTTRIEYLCRNIDPNDPYEPAMIFNPGDAPPPAGTWGDEDLSLIDVEADNERRQPKKPKMTVLPTLARAQQVGASHAVHGMFTAAAVHGAVKELLPGIPSDVIDVATTVAPQTSDGRLTYQALGTVLHLVTHFQNVVIAMPSLHAAAQNATSAAQRGKLRLKPTDLVNNASYLGIDDPYGVFSRIDPIGLGYITYTQLCTWLAQNNAEWELEAPAQPVARHRSPSRSPQAQASGTYSMEAERRAARDTQPARRGVSSSGAWNQQAPPPAPAGPRSEVRPRVTLDLNAAKRLLRRNTLPSSSELDLAGLQRVLTQLLPRNLDSDIVELAVAAVPRARGGTYDIAAAAMLLTYCVHFNNYWTTFAPAATSAHEAAGMLVTQRQFTVAAHTVDVDYPTIVWQEMDQAGEGFVCYDVLVQWLAAHRKPPQSAVGASGPTPEASRQPDFPSTSAPPPPPPPQQLSLHDRVVAMYVRYNPDRLSTVPAILEKYRGREDALLQALVRKYGDEPAPPAPTEPTAQPTDSYYGAASSSSTRFAPPPPGPSYQQRVEAIYRHYNRERIDKVPAIMDAYSGREEELIAALVKKYGPEPTEGRRPY